MKKIELLNKKHKRNKFECLEYPALARYIKRFVSQDIKRDLTSCYVLPDDNDNVIGYYTLSNESVDKSIVPEWADSLPYPRIPVTLLGRMAMDDNYAGQGLGEQLLRHALLTALELSTSIGSVGVITDPKDKKSAEFYEHFGFVTFSNDRMFLPMGTIQKVFAQVLT